MAIHYGDHNLQDYMLKSQRLVFEINVDASASTFTVDPALAANGIVVIRHESDTATVDALESSACWDVGWSSVGCVCCSGGDARGVFGVFINAAKLLSDNCALAIDKVHTITIDNLTTGTATVTPHGDNYTRAGVAEEEGLTTAGNIAFTIDSNQNLASTDVRFKIAIDFLLR
jgi:hypothetical protein